MKVDTFVDIIGADFYTGVPDSQLKPLCNYLMDKYGIDYKHHIIAANEGNCVGLAAGYYLATKQIPVVYLQNSGLGNIINPVASLLNDKVYAIPVIFIVGWRGEPNVKDEPQHIYQGAVTEQLLKDMDIEYFVITPETTDKEIEQVMVKFKENMNKGKSVAFVVKKGALSFDKKINYKNSYTMVREEIIKHIVKVSGESPIISTTGKTSRELFEIREGNKESHKYDFLTVGSMGHSSSIALSIALQKKNTKVYCIDGDGAAIMHLGAMAVIGTAKPENLIHIVINNEAHESVGGLPTVANSVNISDIAKDCGYEYVATIDDYETLDKELLKCKDFKGLSFIEIKSAIGSRDNLGRPTTTPIENRDNFMQMLDSFICEK